MNKFAMTAATAALMLSLSAGALAASGLGSVTTMSGAGAEADKVGSVTLNTTMCALELDDAGKIVSVSVPENNETPGLGADLIADQSVFDALTAAAFVPFIDLICAAVPLFFPKIIITLRGLWENRTRRSNDTGRQ